MFKKLITLLLAIAMVASLAACVTVDPNETGGSNKPDDSQTGESKDDTPDFVFEEQTLVDNETCVFKITAVDEGGFMGYTLKAYLENKTDKTLMFTMGDASVNGFMCDPVWAATVTPGMKSNEDIYFLNTDLDRNGITSVTEIEFTLDVYDSNDILADHLVTETFTVYPKGEDAVQTYVRQPQNGEVVLFDNENCTMIVTGFDPDNMWGYAVNVYVENKTDKTLMFTTHDAAVNGFMCDPLWAETVAPGKRSNIQITWFESSLKQNNITEVTSLTLPVRVYDSNDWLADAFVDETFTVTP